MARIGVWIPFTTEKGACAGLAMVRPTGLDARILRLRDRAAPSGYAPLAVVLDLGQRIAALETDLIDLRTRVGDLEREPDESPISEADRKGPLEAGEPAPVRPEPAAPPGGER